MEDLNNSNVVAGLEEYATDADLSAVELFRDYPVPLLQFASVCCLLFMIIGVPGNLITVLALAKYKQIQNATAVFVIHLSISDLLICCVVFPTLSMSFWTRAWILGKIFCHFFPLINYMLLIVSLLTILAITVNRYVLICHPELYVTLYTTKNISIMLIIIWAFSLILLLMPFFEVWGRLTLDPHVGVCTIVPDQRDRNPKKFIVCFLIAFACATMLFCYVRIVWMVRKKSPIRKICKLTRYEIQNLNNELSETSTQIVTGSTSTDARTSTGTENADCFTDIDLLPISVDNDNTRRSVHINPRISNKKTLPTKKDKKLLMMVIAIMLCFLICYLPITLTMVVYQGCKSCPVGNIVGYLMIYLTACINPIIYVLMSKEYRMAYKSLFKRKRRY